MFLPLILNRRSIRKYQDKAVGAETIDLLVEALLRAPTSLDLGSCWIQIRERPHDDSRSAEAYIADVLNLPAHLRVLSIIAIGYPDETKAPHPGGTLAYDRVSVNSHGTPYPRRP